MRSFFYKYRYFAVVMLILSAIILSLFYNALKPQDSLPIYQPADFNPELVDSSLHYVKKYHTIDNFSLINQNGELITEDSYEGKIYVADFFFTTCLTICPIMTDNMVDIQERIKDDDEVMLLSHTVTPEIDSVPQLKKYAREKGVMDEKWNLVTGDKEQIYTLARKSYLAVKDYTAAGPFDMIHTENFILVDKERRIRGTYNGTDTAEIERLMTDIAILKKSYEE